jgi:hypothetical protein
MKIHSCSVSEFSITTFKIVQYLFQRKLRQKLMSVEAFEKQRCFIIQKENLIL